MSRPSPTQVIARAIIAFHPLDAPPRTVIEITATLARVHFALSNDASQEFAADTAGRVATALATHHAATENSNGFNRFEFNSSSADYIQGSAYVQPDEEGTTRAAAKRNRAHYDSYVSFLQQLSWREFEACCKGILHALGCADPTLTAKGNDQGIDFFGQLSLQGRLDNFSELPGFDSTLRVWLVGQAKHYKKTQVATPDLRELVGSVRLARARVSADGGKALSDFTPRVLDPIFYVFFTTGSISSDGIELLKNSGMVSMDGSQIAVFLSDNQVGTVGGVFDQTASATWIASLA